MTRRCGFRPFVKGTSKSPERPEFSLAYAFWRCAEAHRDFGRAEPFEKHQPEQVAIFLCQKTERQAHLCLLGGIAEYGQRIALGPRHGVWGEVVEWDFPRTGADDVRNHVSRDSGNEWAKPLGAR